METSFGAMGFVIIVALRRDFIWGFWTFYGQDVGDLHFWHSVIFNGPNLESEEKENPRSGRKKLRIILFLYVGFLHKLKLY